MSRLNHANISAILGSDILGKAPFGHGQIDSAGDAQRMFAMLASNAPISTRKLEKVDDGIVRKAFLAVRTADGDQRSPDLYIAELNRNAAFLAKCRAMGIQASDYAINKRLLAIRKSGKLGGLDSQRFSLPIDDVAFACEFAATELKYRFGASIDDILCDPAMSLKFDAIASKLSPGRASLNYRWAIFSIRKAGRHTKVPMNFVMPAFSDAISLSLNDTLIPPAPGVYVLESKNNPLYIRSTENLRQEMSIYREPLVLNAIMERLWIKQSSEIVASYTEVHEKSVRMYVENRMIEVKHPAFNIPRSSAA